MLTSGRCLVALLLGAATAADPPTVTIPGMGSAFGALSDVVPTVAWFKGLPYAAPPTGALRFQPPSPPLPWGDAPRNATAFGNICMQRTTPGLPKYTGPQDEDCLLLNVFAPAAALPARGAETEPSKLLPVMVWIHGGAYTEGCADEYEGAGLVRAAEEQAVVVTLNYRLNVFGFLGGAALQAAAADGSAGNFGIADQRAAMAWVQQHIGAFGGDAAAVTIFGESAGGNSVINHLAQKASFTFYQRAMIESGAYSTGAFDAATAEGAYADVLKRSKCADAACLVGLSAKKLLDAATSLIPSATGWGPVVDGVALTAAPTDLIAAGDYHAQADVVLGSNRDEEAFFFILLHVPPDMGALDFDIALDMGAARYSPAEVKAVKAIYLNASSGYPYPPEGAATRGKYSAYWWAGMRAETDAVPGLGPCAVRWLAKLLLAGGTPNVWQYQFVHPTQTDPYGGHVPGVGPGSVAVPHASEIAFAFGDAEQLTPGAEAELADSVAAYWTNFARNGDPNVGRAVPLQWPPYAAASDTSIRFDVNSSAPAPVGGSGTRQQSWLRREACDFMEGRLKAGRVPREAMWRRAN